MKNSLAVLAFALALPSHFALAMPLPEEIISSVPESDACPRWLSKFKPLRDVPNRMPYASVVSLLNEGEIIQAEISTELSTFFSGNFKDESLFHAAFHLHPDPEMNAAFAAALKSFEPRYRSKLVEGSLKKILREKSSKPQDFIQEIIQESLSRYSAPNVLFELSKYSYQDLEDILVYAENYGKAHKVQGFLEGKQEFALVRDLRSKLHYYQLYPKDSYAVPITESAFNHALALRDRSFSLDRIKSYADRFSEDRRQAWNYAINSFSDETVQALDFVLDHESYRDGPLILENRLEVSGLHHDSLGGFAELIWRHALDLGHEFKLNDQTYLSTEFLKMVGHTQTYVGFSHIQEYRSNIGLAEDGYVMVELNGTLKYFIRGWTSGGYSAFREVTDPAEVARVREANFEMD